MTKKCAKPWCKWTFPADSKYKSCEHCRHHDKENHKINRAWQKEARAAKDAQLPGTCHKRQAEPGMELEQPPTRRQRTNSDPNPHDNGRELPSNDNNDDDEFGQEPDENVLFFLFLTKMITYGYNYSWQITIVKRKTFLTRYVQCSREGDMWSSSEPTLF